MKLPIFDFEIPTALPGVDSAILDPRDTYKSASEWDVKAKDLAERFIKNFVKSRATRGKSLVLPVRSSKPVYRSGGAKEYAKGRFDLPQTASVCVVGR